MNLTLTRPAATLSHPTLVTPEAPPRRVRVGLGVRALLKFSRSMREVLQKRILSLACWACSLSAWAAQPIQLHPANPHYFLWREQPTVLISSGEHCLAQERHLIWFSGQAHGGGKRAAFAMRANGITSQRFQREHDLHLRRKSRRSRIALMPRHASGNEAGQKQERNSPSSRHGAEESGRPPQVKHGRSSRTADGWDECLACAHVDVAQASKPAVSQVSKPAECPLGIGAQGSKWSCDSREIASDAASLALPLEPVTREPRTIQLPLHLQGGHVRNTRTASCNSYTPQVWKPAKPQAWKPALRRATTQLKCCHSER